MSVQSTVLERIRGKGHGSIHVPGDFLDLGSRQAVDQALSRLVRAETIRRIARGLYDFPRQHPRLGILSPELPRVAAAIARSTGSRIQLSGAHAANTLGLSTQVPARLVYLTDGPTRRVRIGRRVIDFRHASPRTLTSVGTAEGLVIQALRYLGRSGVTPAVLARVRAALGDKERKGLAKHVSNAPAWMQPALRQIAEPAEHVRARR
jgi:hypothetical protein